MPLIDPDYLRRLALAQVNQGMLPAVDEDQVNKYNPLTAPNEPNPRGPYDSELFNSMVPDLSSDYNTPLTETEQAEFDKWLPTSGRASGSRAYDLQGYWKAMKSGDQWAQEGANGHLPDAWKKPNYPTFSEESYYSSDEHPGGRWLQAPDGSWSFLPGDENLRSYSPETLQTYFKNFDPDARLDLPKPPEAEASALIDQGSMDQGAMNKVNVGMLPAVGRRAADDMTASPAAGVAPAPEMSDQEHWAELLRLGVIPQGDPAIGAKATAEEYPGWMQGPLKAAMLPAVGVSRILGGTPDALAAAGTSVQRAYSGEMPVTQEDPNTGETHITPQALGEGWNAALTAPLGAVAAAPLEGAVGMGVRTKLPPIGKWEKFTENYPDVAPGVRQIDPRSGKEFTAKTLTPEAEAFGKDRRAIQKDLEAGNYDPYFDPAQRRDVDPGNFQAFEDTSNIRRVKPETQEKYDLHARDPEARTKLDEAFDRGLEHASTTGDWYMVGQLADEYVKAYGPEEGMRQFKTKFADAMAATTGGADPTANLMMAHFGNYLKERGLDVPLSASDMPFPIGGRYVTGNMAQYQKMIGEGEGVTPANPKRYNFSGAFQGNKNAMTIDEQMSAPYGQAMPPTGTYGHYQGAMGEFAAGKGVDPRRYQEIGWAGLKQSTGKPMVQHLNEAIERTSRLTGAKPAEVASEGLVKSKRPLYANPKEAAALAPAFYSRLREVTDAAPFQRAPGKSWAGYVKNAQGVKSDELDWTGFGKWAEDQKGMVTKEEVQKYLDENAIDVQEVTKGGTKQPKVVWEQEEGVFYVRDGDGNVVGRHANAAAASRQADEIGNKSGATRFSDYQLPGGENYRELLLTLPQRMGPKHEAWQSYISQMKQKYGVEEGVMNKMSPAELNQLNKLHHAAGNGAGDRDLNFTSSHYDEPNILAHMRFNDRVDANGKKTLFIEEIQSDWHQKGRKQGYGGRPLKVVEENGRFIVRGDQGQKLGDFGDQGAAQDAARKHVGAGVPDAPFKKDWHELALKRAIKYAADNGYDQIAWTPGAVQAERYDLSKHIDRIDAVKGKNGTYDISATPKDRHAGGIHKQGLSAEELADTIGKDMAEKIVKDLHEGEHNVWGVKNRQSGNWSPRFASKAEAEAYQSRLPESTREQTNVQEMTPKFTRTYEGIDLKVGGEGMKGFYDKMLPDAANKIGKKYGAKIGTTKVTTEAKGSAGGIASNGKEFWVPLPNGEKSPKFDSYIKADDWRSDYLHGRDEVWTLPITPALKEQAIKKGFPVSALEDLTRAVG